MFLPDYPDNLGNDLSAFFNLDMNLRPYAQPFDFIIVVQRGVFDGGAGEEHRVKALLPG